MAVHRPTAPWAGLLPHQCGEGEVALFVPAVQPEPPDPSEGRIDVAP